MKLEDIKKVGIIGAGAMGNQIAEFLARHCGYEVSIVDTTEELVNKGIKAIDDRLERFFVAKGKISADEKKDIMSRIKPSVKLEEAVKLGNKLRPIAIEGMVLEKIAESKAMVFDD